MNRREVCHGRESVYPHGGNTNRSTGSQARLESEAKFPSKAGLVLNTKGRGQDADG